MTLRFRRWLFTAFVLAFLIMASVIIPYAFGYKLDPAGFKLQKTGMFVIETEPKGALIYLNKQLQTSKFLMFSGNEEKAIKSPAKLSHITPNTYTVRLELDGYWPWEKELTVKASETTYLEDVKFFKRNLPELILDLNLKNIITSSSSPDREYLAYSTDKEISLYNFTDQSTKVLASGKYKQISWSKDSQWVFTGLLAINIKDGSVVNLEKVANGIMTPFWPAAESNQLCYQNKNGVYQLNLKSSESKVLLIKSGEKNAPIIDCLIKDGYSYIIKQSKNQSVVIIAKPGETKELGIINLPRLANYSFINSDSKWLNVLDNNNHKLMLIDVNLPWTSQYTLKNISNQANISYWIDSHRLLYANDFEIWLYDTTTNKDTLLTRIGHTINNVFWHPSRNYIIFATDSNINSLELDNRERHNITQLLEMPIVGKAEMDKAGKTINFFGQIGQKEGYWQLEL